MKFIDTHCHLNHHSFQEDIDSVLERAFVSGVEHIIVPGWDVESSKIAIELSEKHPQLWAAIGIHPEKACGFSTNDLNEIKQLFSHPKVVAIGEIGLDYYHDPDHASEQKKLIRSQLDIATETKKKVILHSRQSMSDLIDIIIPWAEALKLESNPIAPNPGVFHAYEGNLDDANYLSTYGFLFGVGGPLTYKNSLQKQEVFSSLSLDHILFETDAPYLAPQGHRGERNEPSFLPIIGKRLVELRGDFEEDTLMRIFENSNKMFIEDIIR